MSIRLLLDARKIFDGGIGVYTQNIIEALSVRPEVEISLLLPKDRHQQLLDLNPPWIENVSFIFDSAKVLSFDEYFNLAKRVNFQDFDIFHTPFITLPFKIPIPTIVTIHDLIQITHPEKFYYSTFAKIIIGSSIKRASSVLTVSQHTAKIIKEYFGSSSKVSIIPNVLNQTFMDPNKKLSHEFQFLGNDFLMAIFSNLKPHKGFRDLILSFAALIEAGEIPEESKLVVVGSGLQSNLINQEIAVVLDKLPQIVNVGVVSNQQLVELLVRAKALIVSSYVEGFCLPVIQAHSQGTPVVVRPVPAILELLGEGDLVASDFSLKSFQAVLKESYLSKNYSKTDYQLDDYDLSRLSDRLIGHYESCINS